MTRTSSLRPRLEFTGDNEPAAASAPGRDIDQWLAETLAGEAARLRASADPSRSRSAASKAGKPGQASPASKQPAGDVGSDKAVSSAGARPRTVLHREASDPLAERVELIERRIEDARDSSLADTLRAIAQLEERRAERSARTPTPAPTPAPPVEAARPQPDFEAALRGFEARIDEISQRVAAAPQPLGRRGLAPADEVARAVQDVRAHQTALAREARPSSAAARPAPPEAIQRLETLSQSQATTLESIRSEIAGLSGRLEARPPVVDPGLLHAEMEALRASLQPSVGSGGDAFERLDALSRSHEAALDSMRGELARLAGHIESRPVRPNPQALQAEIDSLRGSLEGIVTRDDLCRLMDSIAGLSAEITDLHRSGGDPTRAAGEIEALQAEIREIAEARSKDDGRLVDQIDLLFGKIEAVAAAGTDPSVIDGLSRRLDDIRELVTDPSAPKALTALGTQLSELQREVALMSLRQIGVGEFNELKTVVDGMRSVLAAPASRPDGEDGPDLDRPVSQAGSIEAMLAALIDKLDRVERRASDPDALDQLETQIERLAERIGQIPERDPALAALERSTSELLREVASWRDGAAATAERAARSVVAETLGTLPQNADIERYLSGLRAHIDAADDRTQVNLATVQGAIDTVARRVSTLEGRPAGEDVRPSAAPNDRPEPGRPLLRRSTDRSPEAVPPEADQPVASAPRDEILLEPGAGRPAAAPTSPVASSPDGATLSAEPNPAEIRARLIAAARGAMRTAEADASALRKSEPGRRSAMAAAVAARTGSLPGPAELAQRLREVIDRRRRPLLIGAAALVLALGGLQLARNIGAPGSRIAAAPNPAASPVTPPAAASGPDFDPTTTQSIGPSRDVATPDASRRPDAPADAARPGGLSAVVEPASPPARSLPATSAVPGVPTLATAALATKPVPAPDTAAAAVVPPGLRLAASAGNPVALFDLATRNAEGRGVPRDLKLAASLFEKAAEKGLAPAQYRAGNLYEKGVGVPRDLEAARSWYRLAAEGGNTRAMHNLAVLIAESSGGKPDYAAAIAWFQKAAGLGVRDSQFNLAVLYARGLGTPQDLAKAYHWLAIAAAGGDADAGKKRDEVATRLSAPDLARAKAEAGSWRPAPANPAANEVKLPETGWPDAPIKRASR